MCATRREGVCGRLCSRELAWTRDLVQTGAKICQHDNMADALRALRVEPLSSRPYDRDVIWIPDPVQGIFH
jgi:hypothetical protein